MIVRKHFNVLLVDDEPDILQISKIALRSIKVWNIPLKVHTCSSKAEGIEYVSKLGAVPDLALGIIDVVMETDQAGLELCNYIRKDCKNLITPLVVRTGQAGKAPEREVIDKYDISQYITKVEATEDRLYTTVKSLMRQFLYDRMTQVVTANANFLITKAGSRQELLGALDQLFGKMNVSKDGTAVSTVESHQAYFIDDYMVGCGDYADHARAKESRRKLQALKPSATAGSGEMRRNGEEVLLTAASSSGSKVEMLARTNFDPIPDFMAESFMGYMETLRNLLIVASR